jgi:hypothetical protein
VDISIFFFIRPKSDIRNKRVSIRVCGSRINIYLIHSKTKEFIEWNIATSIQECVTDTLERILLKCCDPMCSYLACSSLNRFSVPCRERRNNHIQSPSEILCYTLLVEPKHPSEQEFLLFVVYGTITVQNLFVTCEITAHRIAAFHLHTNAHHRLFSLPSHFDCLEHVYQCGNVKTMKDVECCFLIQSGVKWRTNSGARHSFIPHFNLNSKLKRDNCMCCWKRILPPNVPS